MAKALVHVSRRTTCHYHRHSLESVHRGGRRRDRRCGGAGVGARVVTVGARSKATTAAAVATTVTEHGRRPKGPLGGVCLAVPQLAKIVHVDSTARALRRVEPALRKGASITTTSGRAAAAVRAGSSLFLGQSLRSLFTDLRDGLWTLVGLLRFPSLLTEINDVLAYHVRQGYQLGA